MKDKIQSPLTETVFFVLLAMLHPNHGYGVLQFVEEKTKGRIIFGPGTLYGAINNLSKKKWIKALPEKEDERKKQYVITELGKLNLKYEIQRMKGVLEVAETVWKEEI